MARVAAGEAAAVRECLDRYGGLVWALCRRHCLRASDVEDAAQECFLALWSNAHRHDPGRASEATFIAVIARRRLIDRYRQARRQPATEPLRPHHDRGTVGGDPVEQEDELARVRAALGTLAATQHEVVRLAVVEGCTHQEIAAELKLPLGTVKTHVRRGLLRVREALERPAGLRERGAVE